MQSIPGILFTGKTSSRINAEFSVDDAGTARIYALADHALLQEIALVQLKISTRLGNTPRFIYFPTGEKFETSHNDAIDVILNQHQPSVFNTLIHTLESHTYFVLLTLVIVIAMSWAGFMYGLPAGSKYIAMRLPANVMNLAGTQTLDILDRTQMNPTRLSQEVQDRVLSHFKPAIDENKDLRIKVLFRHSKEIGANAFALPDGTIIFTDGMVMLAKNDDELLAVFAHEIGHLRYRHSLRAAIQSSSLGFFVSMLTGDLSAASSVLTALPVVLTTMSYSRDFEREADRNALKYLDAHSIPRMAFVTLMERVAYETHCDLLLGFERVKDKVSTSSSSAHSTQASSAAADDLGANILEPVHKEPLSEAQLHERKLKCDQLIANEKADSNKVMDYFSTHPATEERLLEFRK